MLGLFLWKRLLRDCPSKCARHEESKPNPDKYEKQKKFKEHCDVHRPSIVVDLLFRVTHFWLSAKGTSNHSSSSPLGRNCRIFVGVGWRN